MVCLLSAPEAMSYDPHAGFQPAEQAWWIPGQHESPHLRTSHFSQNGELH